MDVQLCGQPAVSLLQQQGMDKAMENNDQDNPAWIVSDEFRMYHFKITLCSKRYNHDWNYCPFAHTGERACRRDPLQYNYTSVTCLDMLQKGKCPWGDACTAAHSVFEFWLHPHRYRTEMCKVGVGCNRRICFFAHKPEELRPLPEHLSSADGSTAGGKYSLSAALPEGSTAAHSKDTAAGGQQQQGTAAAAAADADCPPLLSKLGALVRGGNTSSSSSSSTNIVNLSSSLFGGSTGGSTGNSPSTATTTAATARASWLLPGADGVSSSSSHVLSLDGLGGLGTTAYAAAGVSAPGSSIAASTALLAQSHMAVAAGSPQQQQQQQLLHVNSGVQLPPRMPQQHASNAAAGSYVPFWQQHVTTTGLTLQQQQHVMLMPMQQQQQQSAGLVVSNGLTLSLQQLSLGDVVGSGGAAAAAAAASSAPAAAGLHSGALGPELLPPVGWHQQQHPKHHQQFLHPSGLHTAGLSGVSNGSAASGLMMGNMSALSASDSQQQQQHHPLLAMGHSQHQQHQQQLLGPQHMQAGMHAAAAAAAVTRPQMLCGVGLQQPAAYHQAANQMALLQPGQVLADGTGWQGF